MTDDDVAAILLKGACIGLGWNGLGTPPRWMRREAERRLQRAGKNQRKANDKDSHEVSAPVRH